MATRKKNVIGEDAAGAVINTRGSKILKGNHLTVVTHQNGKTELIWDDEALLNEIRNAIIQFESTTVEDKPKKKAPAKKTTKGKTK